QAVSPGRDGGPDNVRRLRLGQAPTAPHGRRVASASPPGSSERVRFPYRRSTSEPALGDPPDVEEIVSLGVIGPPRSLCACSRYRPPIECPHFRMGDHTSYYGPTRRGSWRRWPGAERVV